MPGSQVVPFRLACDIREVRTRQVPHVPCCCGRTIGGGRRFPGNSGRSAARAGENTAVEGPRQYGGQLTCGGAHSSRYALRRPIAMILSATASSVDKIVYRMLHETIYDEPHGSAGVEQDDWSPWPAVIVAVLLFVAVATGSKHCHDKNSQHEQASSNTRRSWHGQGPKKKRTRLNPHSSGWSFRFSPSVILLFLPACLRCWQSWPQCNGGSATRGTIVILSMSEIVQGFPGTYLTRARLPMCVRTPR